MEEEWRPAYYGGFALSNREFCISLTELVYDDPFTPIISYDAEASQPWERVDVQREVTKIYGKQTSGQNIYVAASNEGDIYFLGPDGIDREKISDMGILSNNRRGKGLLASILQTGETLFVSGQNLQLLNQKSREGWKQIALETLPVSHDFRQLNFNHLAGKTTDLYVVAKYDAFSYVDFLPDVEATNDADFEQQDAVAKEIFNQMSLPKYGSNRLLHWNGVKWDMEETPRNDANDRKTVDLNDVFFENRDKIWVVGGNSTIMLGNSREGFEDVCFDIDNLNLLSITKFKDQIIVASTYALHIFDGTFLKPLKPKLGRTSISPNKIQAVDDVMFLFDYNHGVSIWDGESWHNIEIPADLLEKEFKGLK